jgi:hypothetical protein
MKEDLVFLSIAGTVFGIIGLAALCVAVFAGAEHHYLTATCSALFTAICFADYRKIKRQIKSEGK